MSLLRFLGLGPRNVAGDSEPESLAELGRQLESLPPETSRLVAAFAYLLARIAGADLRVDDTERAAIAEHLERFGGLEAERRALLADGAVRAIETHGATDHHLVARAFRDLSEPDERIRLLRCLYAVAAADETISTREDNEIFEIARSLGVDRSEVVALRSEFRQYLGALRALPGER